MQTFETRRAVRTCANTDRRAVVRFARTILHHQYLRCIERHCTVSSARVGTKASTSARKQCDARHHTVVYSLNVRARQSSGGVIRLFDEHSLARISWPSCTLHTRKRNRDPDIIEQQAGVFRYTKGSMRACVCA